MPELAEVEYFRRRWDCGLGQRILRVATHGSKRIFRELNVPELERVLPGTVFTSSEARGKQLLFRFSGDHWLGLHLGMSGALRADAAEFLPGKHDHLVLFQAKQALVFNDPRLFGRVRFDFGPDAPAWWVGLPPAVNSTQFTRLALRSFLRRHPKLPIKATLLLQSGFPGIGNWMADEILWRSKIAPDRLTRELSEAQVAALWRSVRFVSRGALRHVGNSFSDPPRSWLFHERWGGGGRCPIHGCALARRTIGGRTTAWCRDCQK